MIERTILLMKTKKRLSFALALLLTVQMLCVHPAFADDTLNEQADTAASAVEQAGEPGGDDHPESTDAPSPTPEDDPPSSGDAPEESGSDTPTQDDEDTAGNEDTETIVPDSSLIVADISIDIPEIVLDEPTISYSLYPTGAGRVDIRNTFYYKSLADIAAAELYSPDNTEFPMYSDSVKYNSWYHGSRVCNNFADGVYEQRYSWNVAFVTWCADQASLVSINRFPRTADGSVLYSWFLSHGASIHSKAELMTWSAGVSPNPDDLIFLPTEDNYWVGIVTGCSDGSITFVQGDVDCTVVKTRVPLSSLPDDAFIVKWQAQYDYLLPYLRYLCDEIGFTPTAAVGVLANIKCESGFNPHSLGDGGTSYGLCQWHNGRWTDLVRACESAGLDYTTAEGQMYFLKQEMQRYSYLFRQMNSQPATPFGAYTAAYLFCYNFERPAALEEASDYRGAVAEKTLFPALMG